MALSLTHNVRTCKNGFWRLQSLLRISKRHEETYPTSSMTLICLRAQSPKPTQKNMSNMKTYKNHQNPQPAFPTTSALQQADVVPPHRRSLREAALQSPPPSQAALVEAPRFWFAMGSKKKSVVSKSTSCHIIG